MRNLIRLLVLLLVISHPMDLWAKGSKEKESSKEKAVFAGGCFWCMEPEFENIPGVLRVTSGYTGGNLKNPRYQDVLSGSTGHVESIEVTYDPKRVSYPKLLEVFWENVDPLDPDGQFCDKGAQYRAGIFYYSDDQKVQAEQSLADVVKKLRQPVTAFIRQGSEFYPAEDYHQEYSIKNKERYKLYRDGCGRDARLKKIRMIMNEQP